MHLNLVQLVEQVGYVGIFVCIFLESFPMTFFLPGDSLLFTTGFLASQGHFNLTMLITILFLASISGYMFSYAMGEKLRDIILRSNDVYWFKKKHLEYTQQFYDKYGVKTVIIGRFVPIVRSFGPTLAGAVKMQYSKFIRYTILGGIFWTGGLTSIGFYLGKSIPGAHLYLTPIILAIIFVSLLPTIIQYIQNKRENRNK